MSTPLRRKAAGALGWTSGTLPKRPDPERRRASGVGQLITTHLCGIKRRVNPRLTAIQAQVLHSLRQRFDQGESAPTYRDLCAEFGWASTATARDHLRALARKGYIRLSSGHRQVRLLEDRRAVAHVPLVGRVTAGVPVASEENITQRIPVPAEWTARGAHFALRVAGDSMRDAGIFDGDHVVVRQQSTANDGDIVVATLDGETTLKRLHLRRGHARLVAENPQYGPIEVQTESAGIQGVVVGLLRAYESRLTSDRTRQRGRASRLDATKEESA